MKMEFSTLIFDPAVVSTDDINSHHEFDDAQKSYLHLVSNLLTLQSLRIRALTHSTLFIAGFSHSLKARKYVHKKGEWLH